jgi:probable DNA metabolism protein
MRTIFVKDFDDWRRSARQMVRNEVVPGFVSFRSASDAQQQLAWEDRDETISPETRADEDRLNTGGPMFDVPRRFLEYARFAACHREGQVWNLLYRILWRLTHGERRLLEDAADDDVRQFERMAKAVSRDGHKMKAFVRFRRIETPEGERYVAWHRSDHRVLRIIAPFFARRFTDMQWMILTPEESATWDGEHLSFGPGVPASEAPSGDALDEMWRTYYRSIFNPARIKLNAMRREMPVRYWATLPETRILPEMLAEAPARVAEMLKHAAPPARQTAEFLPTARDLASLAAAAARCEGCELCRRATQTVFGRGPAKARLMLVGEQPGDEEDLRGEPFVGPSGQLLRELTTAAGIAWEQAYLTNAVKHFHWEPRGKRRLHKRPPWKSVAACQDWLEAEVQTVQPRVIVCLGVTPAQAVLGRDSRQLRERGKLLEGRWGRTLVTWHPAAILRAATPEHRAELHAELIAHLQTASAAAA